MGKRTSKNSKNLIRTAFCSYGFKCVKNIGILSLFETYICVMYVVNFLFWLKYPFKRKF